MKSPTLEEIARSAGVHRSTVSLALRNDPRLPSETRERLQGIARKMGYVPNPLVSALMKYRVERRKPAARGLMAFLTAFPTEAGWRKVPAYERMFAGAREQASLQGFRLEPLWLREAGMDARRFNRILHNRNIHAAVVCPTPADYPTLDWVEWHRLSAIAIGYSLKAPDFHRVSHDYYHSMILAVEQAASMGVRKLGLVLHQGADTRVDHLWLAAYLAKHRLSSGDRIVPPLLLSEGLSRPQVEKVTRYFQSKNLDAVLLQPVLIRDLQSRFSSRQMPRVINLGCYDPHGGDTGIYQNYELIGKEAVTQVLSHLYLGERGVPIQSRNTLIRGLWNE
jgi:LacI family transcriptional regulator